MILALAALVALATLAAGQTTTSTTRGQGSSSTTTSSVKSALEKALEQALAHNPDLKVAQAKAHEAEAQLVRTRLQVLQKVVSAHQAVELAKLEVTTASVKLEQLKTLQGKARGVVSAAEVQAAEKELAAGKMKVGKAQADLDFLMGKAPTSVSVLSQVATSNLTQWQLGLSGIGQPYTGSALGNQSLMFNPTTSMTFNQPFFRSGTSSLLMPNPGAYGLLAAGPTGGPATEHIRKALQRKLSLRIKDMPASEVLGALQKTAGDVHLQASTREPAWTEKVSANLKEVPLSAALQLLEDALGGYRVVVRDYGLLIVQESKAPRGAILMTDFLKSKPETDSTNPPAGNVEGKINRVDGNLATISIGSDAGLAKGHTLEVYRLGAKPTYLGRLRIIDVQPKQAVGQVLGKMKESLKVGDQVSSSLLRR
jgi:hypothetical protein